MNSLRLLFYGMLGVAIGSFIFYANKVYEDSKKYKVCIKQFRQLQDNKNVIQSKYEKYLQKSLELEAELNNSLTQQEISTILLQEDKNETNTFDSIIRVKF